MNGTAIEAYALCEFFYKEDFEHRKTRGVQHPEHLTAVGYEDQLSILHGGHDPHNPLLSAAQAPLYKIASCKLHFFICIFTQSLGFVAHTSPI
ncbi:hypothetical protein NNL21_34580 [Paenibacillus mendelii]|nr:hypothetical protein [Paenibacillus mendelii]